MAGHIFIPVSRVRNTETTVLIELQHDNFFAKEKDSISRPAAACGAGGCMHHLARQGKSNYDGDQLLPLRLAPPQVNSLFLLSINQLQPPPSQKPFLHFSHERALIVDVNEFVTAIEKNRFKDASVDTNSVTSRARGELG